MVEIDLHHEGCCKEVTLRIGEHSSVEGIVDELNKTWKKWVNDFIYDCY